MRREEKRKKHLFNFDATYFIHKITKQKKWKMKAPTPRAFTKTQYRIFSSTSNVTPREERLSRLEPSTTINI